MVIQICNNQKEEFQTKESRETEIYKAMWRKGLCEKKNTTKG